MKLKLKLGQSEAELSGWNLIFFALAGFGLIAPGPAAALLRTLETRLRGAGAATVSWFFDPRPNPAGGPPQPSRWDVIVEGFHQVRVTLFWLYLLEMVGVFILYTFLPFFPYFGGGMVCLLFIAMALTPYVLFFFVGGEFLLPGLDALAQAVPGRVRGQLGGAVDALKRGLIRTMIPISVLYLLLGIMAIFLSPPILTHPGIQWMARPLVFALFVLAGALFLLGRNMFKFFSVLIIVGTAVAVVGSHSWWQPPDVRETALDTAENSKMAEEANLILKGVDVRKLYKSAPFWKEIVVGGTTYLRFETLPAGVEVATDASGRVLLLDLTTVVQVLCKTVVPAAFWKVDAATGDCDQTTLPNWVDLGIINTNPTLPNGVVVVGPAMEVNRRDDPSVRGFIAMIDTDYGDAKLIFPIVRVWMRSDPRVSGYMSVADLDRRPDPWEDRPADHAWWRQAWGYFSGHRPPDPVPTRPYSPPPATGTSSALTGSSAQVPSVHRGTIEILEGTGSWTVPVDNAIHELPGLKGPAVGATKYVAITGPLGVRVLPMWKDAAGALQPFGAPWITTTGHRYGIIGAPGGVGRTLHVKAW